MNIPRYIVMSIDECESPDGAWCKWEDVEKALKAAIAGRLDDLLGGHVGTITTTGRDRCVCGSEREVHDYLRDGAARIARCADCHRVKTIAQDMGHVVISAK